MTFRRLWVRVGIGFLPAVVACGGSGDQTPPPATGGTAGSAGTMGSGGTAGTGGTGGTAGSGATGGSAGTGGTGGTAGSAGTSGTGGTAGSGGTAGTGAAPGFLACANPEVGSLVGADESGDVDDPDGMGIARFKAPKGLVAISATGLLVADSSNHKIRQVEVSVATLSVKVTTLAVTFSGTPAQFEGPEGVVVLPNNDLLVSDQYNQRIRKITQGTAATVAGNGSEGMADAQGTAASFHYPRGIALAQDGALYIADNGSHAVRRMDPNAAVTTVAGNNTRGYMNGAVAGAQFNSPDDVAVGADGAIYVADTGNHAIRKIAGGTVSTLAGTGTTGFMDGAGASAQFAKPQGVAVHSDGRVFVADNGNQRIRVIDASGTVSTLAGAGPEATPTTVDGPAASARFVGPARVAITSAGLAITDGNRVRLLYCR
jgi:sugar lactone lactonase YvrE